jgi:hypothetical protein
MVQPVLPDESEPAAPRSREARFVGQSSIEGDGNRAEPFIGGLLTATKAPGLPGGISAVLDVVSGHAKARPLTFGISTDHETARRSTGI